MVAIRSLRSPDIPPTFFCSPITITTAKRKVVDAHRTGGGKRTAFSGLLLHVFEQAVGTDQETEHTGNTCGGLAPYYIGKAEQRVRQSCRLSGVPCGEFGDGFGEHLALAAAIVAEELAGPQMQTHGDAVPGQIRERSLITTVHASRKPATQGASDIGCDRGQSHDNRLLLGHNAIDLDPVATG